MYHKLKTIDNNKIIRRTWMNALSCAIFDFRVRTIEKPTGKAAMQVARREIILLHHSIKSNLGKNHFMLLSLPNLPSFVCM